MAKRAFGGFTSRQTPATERVLVLGLGNMEWGDAGAGVRALMRLGERWICPAQVELVNGGTRGRTLVPLLQSARRLIVLSAIDMRGPPGTLHVFTGDAAAEQLYVDGPKRIGMGFADALACAQLSGGLPREIVLIGMQPQRSDRFGAQLSPTVEAQLDRIVDTAHDWLQRWRVEVRPRGARSAANAVVTATGG